jgi:hypothetical protein
MDNVVTQEVFNRIDAMAEKLGTTAQYLWPKLVAYTKWVAIGQIMISVLIFVSAQILCVWSIKRGAKGGWNDPIDFIVSIVSGTFVFGIVLALITSGPNSFAQAFSPEAAAFYKLVGR